MSSPASSPAPLSTGQGLASSWVENAAAWTEVVRSGGIPSRKAGTDAAVVAAVLASRPRRVLDVGCGEGWLARALASQGVETVGIDASAPLIDAARAAEAGLRFEVVSYDALVAQVHEPRPLATSAVDELFHEPFDVVVCNFALLEADLVPLLAALRRLLARDGRLVIQTVHPVAACGDLPYADGWRTETFDGFGGRFPAAMPWYFRTVSSWVACVRDAGFALDALLEPTADGASRPLSLLLVARVD